MNPWALYQDEVTDPDELMAMIAEAGAMRAPAATLTPQASAMVRQQGKGTGMLQRGRDQILDKTLRIENTVTYPDPATIRGLLAEYYNSPQMQGQRANLDAMKEALAARLGMSTPDYASPMSYLANYLTKGRAKIIAPQPSATKQLLDYASKIQDDERDMAKLGNEYLRSIRGGTTQEQQLNQITSELINQAQDPTQKQPRPLASQLPDPKGFVKFYEQNAKDAKEALSYALMAEKTLLSGSKVGYEAFKNFMARASGEKGPLSRDDLLRFQGSQAIADRIDRAWERWASGRMTEADQEDMKILVNAYIDFAKARVADINDTFIDRYARAFRLSPGEARSYLVPKKQAVQKEPEKKKSLIEQILERKKAGK